MADEILDRVNSSAAEEVNVIDESRKVKVGIIGTGWIAEAHVREYLKMPDVEIVAMADIIPGKAEAFAKAHGVEGCKFYPSHKELIDAGEVEAVSICTYNRQHAIPTIYALEHGVNVMLEKPFTVTTEEAVEVMKAEKKSGKILTIGFQPRMGANMQMIKKIVDSGELGKIYYLQAGGGRRHGIPTVRGTSFIENETAGIGAMGDIGCYSLDMLLNAVGYPKPLTVSGYTSNFFGTNPDYYTGDGKPAEYAKLFGVDDFAAGFVRLEGGIILDFRISWAMNMDTCGDALILGTKGGLRIPANPEVECWNGEFIKPLTIYKDVAGRQVKYEVPMINNTESLFYKKLRSFLDAVKNGGTATVPSSQILYNQAIIDGIVKSNSLGREIEIEIPEI